MVWPHLRLCGALSVQPSAGKMLFVPTLASKDGQMDFVRLYDEEDLRAFPVGLWGIPEPPAEWRSGSRQSGVCLYQRVPPRRLIDS